MDEMSVQDIKRDYVGCLVMYKGEPYMFNEIDNNKGAVLYSIEHDKFVIAPFSVKTINANIGRIGLVNTYGAATNMARVPKRVYYIGLRQGNTTFTCLTRRVTDRSEVEYDDLLNFKHKGIVKALRNEYPTLEEATDIAKKERGCCAFDKQFAVRNDRTIVFYTGEYVGGLVDNKIVLSEQYQFLGSILGDYHEKTSRAFKKAPEKR